MGKGVPLAAADPRRSRMLQSSEWWSRSGEGGWEPEGRACTGVSAASLDREANGTGSPAELPIVGCKVRPSISCRTSRALARWIAPSEPTRVGNGSAARSRTVVETGTSAKVSVAPSTAARRAATSSSSSRSTMRARSIVRRHSTRMSWLETGCSICDHDDRRSGSARTMRRRTDESTYAFTAPAVPPRAAHRSGCASSPGSRCGHGLRRKPRLADGGPGISLGRPA